MTTKLSPDQQTVTVQTANSTITTIATYSIPAGSACHYQAIVTGKGAADGLTTMMQGGVLDLSGTSSLLTVITALLSLNRSTGAATWAVTADLSGTTLRIRVTGALATTIDWMCNLNVWVYVP